MPSSAPERLRAYIDRLGREHHLSERDLARVRATFIAKGISLDADASPYVDMIAETVRSLRAIAESGERAARVTEDLRESQADLQTRLQDALRRLQAASSRLQEQAAAIRKLKVPHEVAPEMVERARSPASAPTNKTSNKLVLSVGGIPVVAGPQDLQ